MDFRKIKLGDIVPYENNPRINDYAIEPVMESVRQVGYVTPIIVDEDNVILAGHTRYEALKRLGMAEADCVVISGLSDEQKRKYRILDNKTSELAEWDNDLLKGELEAIDLTGIHWFDDLMNPAVSDLAGGAKSSDKKEKSGAADDDGVVVCPRCGAVITGEIYGFSGDEDDDEVNWLPEE